MTLSVGQLRWRCRRGTRELDCLLSHYLEQHYQHASAAQQQAFHDLLQLEDTQLQHYLLGEASPVREDFAELIQAIKV